MPLDHVFMIMPRLSADDTSWQTVLNHLPITKKLEYSPSNGTLFFGNNIKAA